MMKMNKLIAMLCIGAAVALAGAPAWSAEKASSKAAASAEKKVTSGDAKAAEAAIAAAESARKKAAGVDGEWRDTGKMIKQAQAALKEGDADKAVKLAKQAEMQGQLGYEQAVSQKELKMPSYLKY
jgi:gas vesicle protein